MEKKTVKSKAGGKGKFNEPSKPVVVCNCKRFEQKMDGRFYCRDCGKVEHTVL